MKHYSEEYIRNVALAGHGSSGKTSLAEALLFFAKASDRQGRVESGNTVFDFDPEEIKRVVSVSSAVGAFEWKDSKINLIDTPGLFDFATGLYEGVRAADSVVLVVSAKDGVEVGTEKAFKLARQQGKPVMFFVTKMDAEHADFFKTLGAIVERFGQSACPLVIPSMKGDRAECYVDILQQKAWKYEKGKPSPTDLPDDAKKTADEHMHHLSEIIAETDEGLMEKFFADEPFTQDEVLVGVRNATAQGALYPVLCGAGISMEGMDLLMNAMASCLPAAAQAAGETGTSSSGDKIAIGCSSSDPLAAYVFKTIADPFVGKLSFVKVISGQLNSDITPVNSRTGAPERLGKLLFVTGKKQEDTAQVGAGDIAAITKLADTITGDTLCDPKRVVSLASTGFPIPSLTMAIVAKKKGEEGKIAQGIIRLTEEDPIVSFVQDPETRQQLLSGLGEQHLDVVASRLKSKFGTEIELVKPRVAYRETIRKKVKVQGRHKKQSGGHGQFGDVWIEFEPCDSDELVFCETIFGGSVPRNFFPAVEKGLQESVRRGALAGYPVVGLKATLVDGSYHAVDSSEIAFKTAASLAYRAGISQANPVLLEPIGNLKVYVPDTYTGDIIGDLNKRRGRILGMNPFDDGLQEIEGEVPMSEMHDFTTTLRSVTQGRGHFVLTFSRYEQLPSHLEAAVIAEAKALEEES
jgi:elongation factor G